MMMAEKCDAGFDVAKQVDGYEEIACRFGRNSTMLIDGLAYSAAY